MWLQCVLDRAKRTQVGKEVEGGLETPLPPPMTNYFSIPMCYLEYQKVDRRGMGGGREVDE